MKIKFEIDVIRKVISIYFKESELSKWTKNAIKKFPKMENKELAEKGSNHITYVVAKAFEQIGKEKDLDLLKYTPKPIVYQKESELPIHLRN